jgi:pyrimidine operon attenuation protein/uracil phosphoribosyltransferase
MSLAIVRTLLDAQSMDRALRRVALQIIEGVGDLRSLALVGIRTRGVPLAQRIRAHIKTAEGITVPVGELDITLYRDDVFEGAAVPEVRPTVLPFEVAGKHIVLIDDVLYTGRTVRAAIDALMDWGRPTAIRLAVLVDRGHRELPLHADYIGCIEQTLADESVAVRLTECDDAEDSVIVRQRSEV